WERGEGARGSRVRKKAASDERRVRGKLLTLLRGCAIIGLAHGETSLLSAGGRMAGTPATSDSLHFRFPGAGGTSRTTVFFPDPAPAARTGETAEVTGLQRIPRIRRS
ncbi:MAG: hypothetical protein ACP5OO_06810, partial [Chloroflexia bacterium]